MHVTFIEYHNDINMLVDMYDISYDSMDWESNYVLKTHSYTALKWIKFMQF